MSASPTRRGPAVRTAFPVVRQLGTLAKAWTLEICRLTGFFTLLILLLPAKADPVLPVSSGSPTGAFSPSAFGTVSHLGESEEQAALRTGQLLSHRRATDPFGNIMRGAYKGLPPVVEHAAATTGPAVAAGPIAPAADVPTLEKAVQELAIGAVNVGAHEFLVGSRSVHEGDLLVLESGGRQFVVWVQDVGVRGVLFCDIDLQRQFMKPFGSGPKVLPGSSVWGISDIHNLLNKDAAP